jgi:hypothetical protein
LLSKTETPSPSHSYIRAIGVDKFACSCLAGIGMSAFAISVLRTIRDYFLLIAGTTIAFSLFAYSVSNLSPFLYVPFILVVTIWMCMEVDKMTDKD